MNMSALSPIESYALSNGSICPIVIRENEFADIRNEIVGDVLKLRNNDEQSKHARLFHLAGIGSTEATNVKDTKHRGDFRCWLLPSVCAEHELNGCRELIRRITRMCCNSELKQSLRLNGDYSVQVTKYPGNGAHYVRHLDTAGGAATTDYNNTVTTSSTSTSSSGQRHRGVRKLTFIYYLNPLSSDYNVAVPVATSALTTTSAPHITDAAQSEGTVLAVPVGTGGQLRVYGIPTCASSVCDGNTVATTTDCTTSSTSNATTYMDVEPSLGKLVVSRSDKVEHEVLATFRDRWAISVWAYAHDNNISAPVVAGPLCLPAPIAGHVPVPPPAHLRVPTAPEPHNATTGGPNLSALLGLLHPQWQKTHCNTHNKSNSNRLHSVAAGPPPLPLPTSSTNAATTLCSSTNDSPTIFVSIVSYRDSELPHTVVDLFRTAAHPANVYVGIVYQIDSSTDTQDCVLRPEQLSHLNNVAVTQRGGVPQTTAFEQSMNVPTAQIHTTATTHYTNMDTDSFYTQHIRTLTLPHSEAKGPIYARSLAAGLYRGEQYVLQIDSHMRFRRTWDAYLIDTLESLRNSGGGNGDEGGKNGTTAYSTSNTDDGEEGTSSVNNGMHRVCKPVLTTYPQGYFLPNSVPTDTRPTVLMPSRWDENGFLRQEGKLINIDHDGTPQPLCLRSPLWAAGFSFSTADVLREVPYSPLLPHLFFGEELSMAARLFTHGYDLFAPAKTVCYHLYSRAHRPNFQELQRPVSVPPAPTLVPAPVSVQVTDQFLKSSKATTSVLPVPLPHAPHPPHPPQALLPPLPTAPPVPAVPPIQNQITSPSPRTSGVSSADLIAAEKATSQCLLQHLLDLPVHPQHRALCRSAQFARLLDWQQRAYGLGHVRSLEEFRAMLAEVGVTFPSSNTLPQSTDSDSEAASTCTAAGSVSVDAAQRLRFVCSHQPSELAARVKFAQSGVHNNAVSVPDGNTNTSSCEMCNVNDGKVESKSCTITGSPAVPVAGRPGKIHEQEGVRTPPAVHAHDLSKLLGAAGALERIKQFL